MKLWDKIKSHFNRPSVKKVLVATCAGVAGGMSGGLGAAVVAAVVGTYVYSVGTEYIARKNKAMQEIAKENHGRPLTTSQKKKAYGKALVDTLGVTPHVPVASLLAQDVNTAKAKTRAKVNKNKTKEAPKAVPPVKINTNAFNFTNLQNQGGRKF
ncbi:MAG: hypothetical protein J6N49_04890 [Alphaproteobacteria bacterium]|nr:hypothetical protein [Alphaproteobacteria bacterium]